jgi:deazaflavin-dependent oxidoreductase (nitroreductase family)
MVIATSEAMTWIATISLASAWVGLTLPGMIEDPGSLAGKTSSGRRTGLRRRTPVCDGLEGETFWLIAQRGRDADWVRNIEGNPRVRVKVSGVHAGWRAGTAHILDDDDRALRTGA